MVNVVGVLLWRGIILYKLKKFVLQRITTFLLDKTIKRLYKTGLRPDVWQYRRTFKKKLDGSGR